VSRSINTYDDLREVVLQNKGLHKVSMGVLRDIEDAGRLGKIVRDRIHTNLGNHRLGHLPVDLPNDQNDLIRIYDKGSDLSSLIEAVLHPSDAGDKALKSLGGRSASKKLADLRLHLEEAIELIDN